MKVFLLNSKILSEVTRKEELTDDSYLVTDEEAEKIRLTLEGNGHFWVVDNQLRMSGKRPDTYYEWSEDKNDWVINEATLGKMIQDEKDKVWEEIKERRQNILTSGVKMNIRGVPKWFHTDLTSQQSYDRANYYLSLNLDKFITWKTMDNSFVDMYYDDIKDLILHIFVSGQQVFHKAEEKRAELYKLTTLEEVKAYNTKSGWPEVYRDTVR